MLRMEKFTVMRNFAFLVDKTNKKSAIIFGTVSGIALFLLGLEGAAMFTFLGTFIALFIM